MLLLAEQNRAFGYAAVASLALHAALLLSFPPWPRKSVVQVAEPPLVAHLVEPAPPAAPAPPPPLPKVEPPKPPKPAAKKAAPQKRMASVKRKAQSKVPPPPAPEPELPKEEAAAPTPTPAAPAAPAAPPTLALARPAAPVDDPAAALARFRHELVTLAMRYKRYPRVALDNGWAGDVLVRIDVAASGGVAAIRVKTSSGYEILDAQALEMFRKALPGVAVPSALRGKDFSVEVRAIYNLKDRPG